MVGFADKADELKPLACLAGVTGGTFVAATNAGELKQGLATVLDAIADAGGRVRRRPSQPKRVPRRRRLARSRRAWPAPCRSILGSA